MRVALVYMLVGKIMGIARGLKTTAGLLHPMPPPGDKLALRLSMPERSPSLSLESSREEVENTLMAHGFRRALPIVVATMLCSSTLLGQSQRPEDLRAGKLLVAKRGLLDPNFSESVVLLVDHGSDGALGLILNHPSSLPASHAMAELEGSVNYSGPAYRGGPVARGAVMALLRSQTEPHPRKHIFGDVYLVSQRAELESALAAGAGSNELRIYLGYAGWGPGQLENELRRGDWYLFDGSEELVFDSDPEGLWDRLIVRTELRIARNP